METNSQNIQNYSYKPVKSANKIDEYIGERSRTNNVR